MPRLIETKEPRPEHSTVINWTVPVYIKNGEDYYKVCFDIKRKPLSDGTLPLTNGEMSELCEIMGYQNICKIFYDNKLHFKCFDKGWGIITDVKAVLYLAERFDLTGKK